jgi:MYXO-CTERM domain-containing protein
MVLVTLLAFVLFFAALDIAFGVMSGSTDPPGWRRRPRRTPFASLFAKDHGMFAGPYLRPFVVIIPVALGLAVLVGYLARRKRRVWASLVTLAVPALVLALYYFNFLFVPPTISPDVRVVGEYVPTNDPWGRPASEIRLA